MHWIYENEEDEKSHPNPSAKKIFVMFDFPMLLQVFNLMILIGMEWLSQIKHFKSAMGPGRDLEENASARIRNIETFEVGFILLTIIIAIIGVIEIIIALIGNSSEIPGKQRLSALQGPRHLPRVQQ